MARKTKKLACNHETAVRFFSIETLRRYRRAMTSPHGSLFGPEIWTIADNAGANLVQTDDFPNSEGEYGRANFLIASVVPGKELGAFHAIV
jgi:hypothetical protein